MNNKADVGLVTVTGIVVPCEWGEQCNAIVAVAIETDDEKEYIVTARDAVKELLKHRHQPVEVVGRIRRDDSGRAILVMEHHDTVSLTSAWGNDRTLPGYAPGNDIGTARTGVQ